MRYTAVFSDCLSFAIFASDHTQQICDPKIYLRQSELYVRYGRSIFFFYAIVASEP